MLMRKLLAAAIFVGAGLLATGSVNAMPAMSADMGASANITQVAGGCGPHFHRTPYGCRPNYYRRPVYHHCQPGYRWGSRGCFR
jgi:hypothetical protein